MLKKNKKDRFLKRREFFNIVTIFFSPLKNLFFVGFWGVESFFPWSKKIDFFAKKVNFVWIFFAIDRKQIIPTQPQKSGFLVPHCQKISNCVQKFNFQEKKTKLSIEIFVPKIFGHWQLLEFEFSRPKS